MRTSLPRSVRALCTRSCPGNSSCLLSGLAPTRLRKDAKGRHGTQRQKSRRAKGVSWTNPFSGVSTGRNKARRRKKLQESCLFPVQQRVRSQAVVSTSWSVPCTDTLSRPAPLREQKSTRDAAVRLSGRLNEKPSGPKKSGARERGPRVSRRVRCGCPWRHKASTPT